MDEVVIPPGAGVGSAIGFLRAPVSYELFFLGRGDELNRIYTPYEELASGLSPLVARGVDFVVLPNSLVGEYCPFVRP